jgi:hypothetical protein
VANVLATKLKTSLKQENETKMRVEDLQFRLSLCESENKKMKNVMRANHPDFDELELVMEENMLLQDLVRQLDENYSDQNRTLNLLVNTSCTMLGQIADFAGPHLSQVVFDLLATFERAVILASKSCEDEVSDDPNQLPVQSEKQFDWENTVERAVILASKSCEDEVSDDDDEPLKHKVFDPNQLPVQSGAQVDWKNTESDSRSEISTIASRWSYQFNDFDIAFAQQNQGINAESREEGNEDDKEKADVNFALAETSKKEAHDAASYDTAKNIIGNVKEAQESAFDSVGAIVTAIKLTIQAVSMIREKEVRVKAVSVITGMVFSTKILDWLYSYIKM